MKLIKLILFLTASSSALVSVSATAAGKKRSKESIQSAIEEQAKHKPTEGNGTQSEKKLDAPEALSRAESDSDEIPVIPEAFKPFEKHESTAEEMELRRRAINQIWRTPLGQMFYFFLTNTDNENEQPGYSRQLVHRIFSQSAQAGTRTAAIYLLVSDLIVRGALTDEMSHRVTLLQLDIQQYGDAGMATLKSRGVVTGAIIFVVAGIFGFQRVRDFVGTYWEALEKSGRLGFFAEGHALEYHPSKAVMTFVSTFGAFSMFYYLFLDQSTALLGKSLKDTQLLHGLDEIVRALQF